jgi:hypothetical protein
MCMLKETQFNVSLKCPHNYIEVRPETKIPQRCGTRVILREIIRIFAFMEVIK